MSTVDKLTQFLQSLEPRALAIQGSWGRGKTHLWKRLIRTTPSIHWETYSYVSLFGINSLEELKMAIFEKGISPSKAHHPDTIVSFDTDVSQLPGALQRNWKAAASSLSKTSLPGVGNVGVLYNALVFSNIRKRLVCIDDLERRGKNLDIRDVLGLVTFLCEERQCSVALIYNEETLEPEDRKAWNKHREKVFHGEVTYQPSSLECIDLVFDSKAEDTWSQTARKVLSRINGTNIRIMSRIKGFLDTLSNEYKADISDLTAEQIARSVAVLTYCHNAGGEGAPPIEHALAHSHLSSFFLDEKSDSRTEQQKRWDSFLNSLEYYPDSLDHVLGDMVRHGYPDRERLRSEVESREQHSVRSRLEEGLKSAWRIYHSGWQDNAGEVISAFTSSFPPAAGICDPMNADSAIALVRALGEEGLADDFIEQWIAARRGSRSAEISLSEAQVFRPLKDEKFKKRIVEVEKAGREPLELGQAIEVLAARSGDTDLAIRSIALTEPTDLANFARQSTDRTFGDAMKYLFDTYGGREFIPEATRVARSALAMLSRGSPIVALRILSLGIPLDDIGEVETEADEERTSGDEDSGRP